MGRRDKETLIEMIINCILQEQSENAISETVQKPRTTSHYRVKKFKSVETVENKSRSKCYKKLTDADERWTMGEVKIDARVNASKL
ncbi:hypothetical protein NPIL_592561 [Nephila pilipes]|uniref:Uncharacterized protein n=1 Tax=Nephila pilipes TaxID=299642 RepID=A0A8X6UG28_NEPPI|nr:hypothetical protein NPIL_592561 [Nephila pilipes]